MIDDATARQIAAADPARSTWLTANAGSGKTRVLTDRVARLLLAGIAPERILCLTYTKAAASEMQNRLLQRLGSWAMLPEGALRDQLAQMGIDAGTLGPAALAGARRLFARAIETPGGLKVQTIHAFCAGVLRRFPLEAGVPVGFTELDDRTDAQLRGEILEAMAEAGEPEIADLVGLHSDHEIDRLLVRLTSATSRLDTPEADAALWALAGLPHPYDAQNLLAEVIAPGDQALLAALQPLLAAGGANDIKVANRLAALDWAGDPVEFIQALEEIFLNKEKAKAGPFSAKIGDIPTGKAATACADHIDQLNEFMLRIEAGRRRRIAMIFAAKSAALRRFALRFNALYTAEKRRRGLLSFDDLIARTAAVLSDASMAQWVLFRLDGGIDHILVDEAQDTSPEQWRVIQSLTAEFTAGAGARGENPGRTLFVVGDPKQSIYSFQGADVAVFADRRTGFGEAFEAAGQPMQDAALQYSFRSSAAILSVVDAVFAGAAAEGLGGAPLHRAHRSHQPGRVDLWPPILPAETPEMLAWDALDPQQEARTVVAELADLVERRIAAMLGSPITDRHGQTRPVVPGDVLILVPRRGPIFDAIIRRLKVAGHAVAGADRLKLTAELAVKDIRAVLSVLATPEDDLSLAAALRSPLFDVDEAGLWRLAAGRPGYLWEALREAPEDLAPGLAEARAVISDLLAASTHLRPHDLIARLLIRHGGRNRLLARLGDEAADGIAELLGQALTYERGNVPTLTGFLVWLGDETLEVRRGADQPEGAGMIRIMTVHGAKGLESPIVILPDTAKRQQSNAGPVLPLPGRPAVFRPPQHHRPDAIEAAVAAQKQREEEERRRLLYVAMTRAETWLIVAAAGEVGEGTDSWYAMAAEGFARARTGLTADAVPDDGLGAPVLRLSHGIWPEEAVAATPASEAGSIALPEWLARPPDTMPLRPARARAATGLGGAKTIPGEEGLQDGAEALLTGTRLHLLLEHLPGMPAGERLERARAVLAGADGGLPQEDELAALVAEAVALIDAPDLAGVFAPGPAETVLREVPLAVDLPGLGPIAGTIDRLVVGPERILVIDYKSNAVVPADPSAVPVGIRRQMAAYRDAARLIWPGRAVEVAVMWTRSGTLMPLPDAVLDGAFGNPAMP